MLANNAIGDGKTQSGALFGALGGEEWVVNARKILRSDALSIIGYIDMRHAFVGAGPDRENAAKWHRVARVQEQVEKDLLQFAGIGFHQGQTGVEIELHFHRGLL